MCLDDDGENAVEKPPCRQQQSFASLAVRVSRTLRVGAAFASTTAGDHIEPGEKHAPITGRIVHGPGSLSAAAARG
jgi:hypothetical protein